MVPLRFLSRIRAMDDGLPVDGVSTVHERVVDSLGQTTMSAIPITAFGGLALLLAAVGFYGSIGNSPFGSPWEPDRPTAGHGCEASDHAWGGRGQDGFNLRWP